MATDRFRKQASKFMGDVGMSEETGIISEPTELGDMINQQLAEMEAMPEIQAGREKVSSLEAEGRALDKEAEDVTARTERQMMAEKITAGLAQAIAGFMGSKQGWDPTGIDIKTSDFGQLLSGRLKQVEMKKATQKEEATRAQQILKEKLDVASTQQRFRQMDTQQKNAALTEMAFRLYMQNQEDARRAQDKKNRDQEANLGSISALTQNINKQLGDVQSQRKQASTLIGDLANKDEAKVVEAKRELASMIGADPTTFEGLEQGAIEVKVGEKLQQLSDRAQALNKFSEKLAVKTASKKPFNESEIEAIGAINSGLMPSEGMKVGEIKVSPSAVSNFSTMIKAAQADPALSKTMERFIIEKGNTSWLKADPEAIDVIQKINESGIDSLTAADIKALNTVTKDVNLLGELAKQKIDGTNNTFQEQYRKLISDSKSKRDYDTLSRLAPGSQIGVGGFGG